MVGTTYVIVALRAVGEMKRRRKYYEKYPEAAKLVPAGEERGQLRSDRIMYSHDDYIPLSIEYVPEQINVSYNQVTTTNGSHATRSKTEIAEPLTVDVPDSKYRQKRYLRCKAAVKILHIMKLIRNKYDLKYNYVSNVADVCCSEYDLSSRVSHYSSSRYFTNLMRWKSIYQS